MKAIANDPIHAALLHVAHVAAQTGNTADDDTLLAMGEAYVKIRTLVDEPHKALQSQIAAARA